VRNESEVSQIGSKYPTSYHHIKSGESIMIVACLFTLLSCLWQCKACWESVWVMKCVPHFLVHLSETRSCIVVNDNQQDATILAYLFIPNQLCMFWAMSLPIIRSTW